MKMADFVFKLSQYIKEKKLGFFSFDKSFKELTTLKVGGKIRLLFMPFTIENFIEFYDFYWKNGHSMPLVVIGNGSNILASDNDFEGIVVSFKELQVKYYRLGEEFYFFPQCKMPYIANVMIGLGYREIEYFGGVPGTIGGTVAMNASFLSKSIGDFVSEVVVITKDNIIKKYEANQLKFSYRTSSIKENSDIVLLVKLHFPKGDSELTKKNYLKLLEFRKNKQPLNVLSAGCAFKNPKEVKAWEVIKELGYCGKKIGGAKVSEKHCNFIINTGDAKASDLYEILKSIQRDAKIKKNIELENEWILINFD